MGSLWVEAVKYLLPVIIAIGIMVGVSLVLRKYFPGRLWLGLLLAIFLGPFGQFYVNNGAFYMMLLFVLGYALGYVQYFMNHLSVFVLTVCTVSAVVMFLRMTRAEKNGDSPVRI